MPAVSKRQRNLMGMVKAYKKGELDTKGLDPETVEKIKKMAKDMSGKEVDKYAKTKDKDIKECNSNPEVGFELPSYEEYLGDHGMEDSADSRQQYEEYISGLREEYRNNASEGAVPSFARYVNEYCMRKDEKEKDAVAKSKEIKKPKKVEVEDEEDSDVTEAKLTKDVLDQADRRIDVHSDSDIPLKGLPLRIAKTKLEHDGFYGYIYNDSGEKVLLVKASEVFIPEFGYDMVFVTE